MQPNNPLTYNHPSLKNEGFAAILFALNSIFDAAKSSALKPFKFLFTVG